MAEVAQSAPSPSKAAPKKAAKAAGKAKKEKVAASHPKYIEMAVAALNSLKERGGSSRQAILKYITSNYKVGSDSKVVGTHLKLALKRGVDTGVIKHVKGTGASGSFKANQEAKKKVKKPKAAKKAKASPKKRATKPTATKKAVAAKKSPVKPKSPAKKSPAKKASPTKKKAAGGAKKAKAPAKKK